MTGQDAASTDGPPERDASMPIDGAHPPEPEGGDAATCTPLPKFIRYSPAVSGCATIDLTIPCDLTTTDDAGDVTTADCASDCTPGADGTAVSSCYLTAGSLSEPPMFLECVLDICQTGRRPAGLVPRIEGDSEARVPRCSRPRSGAGAYFAQAARLEEASIAAFRVLARELAAHRSPTRLQRLAERAARDERRHARVMARLARRAGVRPRRARVDPVPLRPLEAIALENGVEGCVRETYGALLAWRQAERARDPEVARAMRGIAVDETRHAELAWAVHRWAARRLARDAMSRVEEAMGRAWSELETGGSASQHDAETRDEAGLPGAVEARALARGLRRVMGTG